jgi:hypothetical protein
MDMKKAIIAVIFLLTTVPAFAQNFAARDYGFRLGLTAHPTFGWLKPEEGGKGNGLSLGFSYGLLADFNFAENYSFATGLTITTINGKSTEINASPYHIGNPSAFEMTPYELKYKLQYLELPFTVKMRTSKVGNVSWYGQFGLSNDFNIGARQDVELDGRELENNKNIKDYTKFYRAGLILGAGGEFDMNNRSAITVGLTYNNGFTNIVKKQDRSVRSHYVGLNLGVFF